jgi:uncharacterized protein (TIGR03118 family)
MKATDRFQFLRQVIGVALVLIAPCAGSFAQDSRQQYTQTNLVSNQSSVATNQDTDLVNAWGMSRGSGTPWWVSDNGTGLSTLYDGSGTKQGLVVTIPPGDPTVSSTGTPTGTIYNGSTTDFLLAPGKPAVFMFATADGTISGWNPGVNPTTAVIKVNQTGRSVFTGLAVAQVTWGATSATYLYVADFQQGRIQVYDTSFNPARISRGQFRDEWLPEGYAPFNVWNIGGNLYVAYAEQSSNKQYNLSGRGLGFVDVFSPSGFLLQRLEHGPWFNAPWGLTLAPSDFGLFSHDVLVGQFGSGEILAFDPVNGSFKGKLLDTSNQPITIDGLWALSFGNGGKAGAATALYFTAGPNGVNGLLGNITPVQNIEGNDQ